MTNPRATPDAKAPWPAAPRNLSGDGDMEWLSQNWFFVLILVVFVGMHLFGHGCGGGHRHRGKGGAGADAQRDEER
jgi:hypothetical protein